MKHFALTAIAALLSAPAVALTPQSQACLAKLDAPPAAEDLNIAEQEGVIETIEDGEPALFSVEGLSTPCQKNRLARFIATRGFAARLSSFDGRTYPPNYEYIYLKENERKTVLDRVKRALRGG